MVDNYNNNNNSDDNNSFWITKKKHLPNLKQTKNRETDKNRRCVYIWSMAKKQTTEHRNDFVLMKRFADDSNYMLLLQLNSNE